MPSDIQQNKEPTVSFYSLYEELCSSCGYTPSGLLMQTTQFVEQ